MAHIDQEALTKLRASLESERATLEEDLAAHGKPTKEGDWQGNSSGLEGEEPDPTDAADQIEELVTNVPLVEELEKRHGEVQSALGKMDKGIYGACEECGEEIPLDRLEANPAARTCIKHAT